MGSRHPARPGRLPLLAVGSAVFLANAGLLVLQLAAGRWLAPFVGSSLETWAATIGAFLAGIAVGNAVGGAAADRGATGRTLALALVAGGVAALGMVALPRLLDATGAHRLLPLGPRIPVLAALFGFPAGLALSLPTPLAVRLALADVGRAGRVAGAVFALGTLGSLAGNYAAGFWLVPGLTVDGIGIAVAGLLFAAAGVVAATVRGTVPNGDAEPEPDGSRGATRSERAALPLPRACAVVFVCSFAGMALELTAARLMAQVLGVSLFTWTGVIGVMLAGTAAGNWVGGWLADAAGRSADPAAGRRQLAGCLALAALAGVCVLVLFFTANSRPVHDDPGAAGWAFFRADIVTRVLAWTFALFFPAMFALGTVSPQAVRLAVPDVGHAGRVAGRVYAWSTAGAIAGTFATGFGLVSAVGAYRTVLVAALLPAAAAGLVGGRLRGTTLYGLSLALGVGAGGFVLLDPAAAGIDRETNYYTIRVTTGAFPRSESEFAGPALGFAALAGPAAAVEPPGEVLALQLDRLVHSRVKLDDPGYLFYEHEQIQLELLRSAAASTPGGPNVLVIGGGGYTFPRAARTAVPGCAVDVVEIDPGVTAVAYARLGLDPRLGIMSYAMDGRQFVAERAAAGRYDLVTLDAVNDLSVPGHLLTKEFNDAVRRTLAPDGVYLLTVIDLLDGGRLWASAARTLRETYPHVRVLTARPWPLPDGRTVFVLYASAAPLDVDALRTRLAGLGVAAPFTHAVPPADQERLERAASPVLLTDRFAPVDNLMAGVFRRRVEPDGGN